MSTAPGHRPPQAGRGTLLGAAILAAVLAAACVLALAVGGDRPRWVEAVFFATAIAGMGAIGGWLVARRPAANPAAAVATALGATVLRIIPPLAGLAWLADRGTPLREAGAGGLLIGFYLVLLATGILLHIMVAPDPAARPTDYPR